MQSNHRITNRPPMGHSQETLTIRKHLAHMANQRRVPLRTQVLALVARPKLAFVKIQLRENRRIRSPRKNFISTGSVHTVG
jgi:hypothetical protein